MKAKALALAVLSSVALAACVAAPSYAEAGGYRSFKPSASFKPRPRIIQRNTIVRKTTVINQRNSSGPSAIGSFLSGAAGAAVGAAVGTAMMAPDQPQQVVEQAPVQPQLPPCDATLYDCTPKQQ